MTRSSSLHCYETVSFLSDFGLADEFVAVVKSVIWSIAPKVRIVDVSHDIARFDVRAGGLTLARASQYLNPGVVLAVVDPGVGGDRRPLAVEIGDGASVLLGPDNGLLAPTVALSGGANRAVELANEKYRLSAPGCTFDGRDVFAPAAAHLCLGVPLSDFGPSLDPDSLQPGVFPAAQVGPERIEAEVLWVDRFGNAQLNVSPDDLSGFPERVMLRFGDVVRSAVRATSYSEISAGGLGLLEDSYGLIAIARNRRSASDELGLQASSAVTLEHPGGQAESVSSPPSSKPVRVVSRRNS